MEIRTPLNAIIGFQIFLCESNLDYKKEIKECNNNFQKVHKKSLLNIK